MMKWSRRSRTRRRSESRQKKYVCLLRYRSRCVLAQEKKQERESERGERGISKIGLKVERKRHAKPHHRRIKKKEKRASKQRVVHPTFLIFR
jgi:hypothetical protein